MPIPNKKNKIERISTKERIYNALREWIVDGTLQPNERLSDKELADHFSVSRTPVREALQMLAEQKFVTVLPSSGTFVAPLDRADMGNVYEMMSRLQCLALELATSRIIPEDISRLRIMNAAFMELAVAGDARGTNRADSKLHHEIAKLSGNDYLVRFTDVLIMQAQRGENLFFRSDMRRVNSYEQHRAIIDALEQGDLKTAQEKMKENWHAPFWEENTDSVKERTEETKNQYN